jgi:hypothetical protein
MYFLVFIARLLFSLGCLVAAGSHSNDWRIRLWKTSPLKQDRVTSFIISKMDTDLLMAY